MSWFRRKDKRALDAAIERGAIDRLNAEILKLTRERTDLMIEFVRQRAVSTDAGLRIKLQEALEESKRSALLLHEERQMNEFLRLDLDGMTSAFKEKLATADGRIAALESAAAEKQEAIEEWARDYQLLDGRYDLLSAQYNALSEGRDSVAQELEGTKRQLHVTQVMYDDMRGRYIALAGKLNKALDERDTLREELSPLERLADQRRAS